MDTYNIGSERTGTGVEDRHPLSRDEILDMFADYITRNAHNPGLRAWVRRYLQRVCDGNPAEGGQGILRKVEGPK
jgi:hypothetical protein